MMHNPKQLYTEHTLGELLDLLDQLHTAASEGRTSRSNEIKGLLRDVIYTAQETLAEIENHEPHLRILKKPPA